MFFLWSCIVFGFSHKCIYIYVYIYNNGCTVFHLEPGKLVKTLYIYVYIYILNYWYIHIYKDTIYVRTMIYDNIISCSCLGRWVWSTANWLNWTSARAMIFCTFSFIIKNRKRMRHMYMATTVYWWPHPKWFPAIARTDFIFHLRVLGKHYNNVLFSFIFFEYIYIYIYTTEMYHLDVYS